MRTSTFLVAAGASFVILGLIVAGAGLSSQDERAIFNSQDVVDAALGIIGRHPCDPKGQTVAIEETGWFDSAIDAATGQLIRQGLVESTPEGLRVVERDKWPVEVVEEEE